MEGARAFRSEIVGVLKTNALAIFGITDIPAGDFFDNDTRDQSRQLAALRRGNTFLYATEEALPQGDRMDRYLRSECLVRVRSFICHPGFGDK